jgi:integrase
MSKRGVRTRIATNIWEDDKRRIGVAKLGPQRQTKRFPKATALRTIVAWIEDTKREFRKRRGAFKRQRGTLAADVLAYVVTLPKGTARSNTAACLRAWVTALGDVQRARLTHAPLRDVVTGWIDQGVAANTIKHRRRALAQLFDALDGPDAPNPARQLKTPREPEIAPRAVSMALLQGILDGMDQARTVRHPGRGGAGFRNKTQARLRMMLWTGITPASLARLKPQHIDLEGEQLTLPPRLKGRGARAVTVPLFPEGVAACRAWLRAFAWGRFDQRALGRSFHAAVRSYVAREAAAGRTVIVPADLRPYDLRHSYLSWLWTETEDILLVQHFAQHADLETTARYTQGAVSTRARSVVDRVKRKRANSTDRPPGLKTA